MPIDLTKDAIDLGIVTTNGPALIEFYRDVVGLEDRGEVALPGQTVRLLQCGKSRIKILMPDNPPQGQAPPGDVTAARGYRYWTISVADVAVVVERCQQAGVAPTVMPREVMPGMMVAIVPDPDGNLVEFVSRQ